MVLSALSSDPLTFSDAELILSFAQLDITLSLAFDNTPEKMVNACVAVWVLADIAPALSTSVAMALVICLISELEMSAISSPAVREASPPITTSTVCTSTLIAKNPPLL